MKGTDVFPGKSLKAADLGNSQPIVVIESVSMEKFNDGSMKPAVHFKGKEKHLVCNKTNWNTIVEITGEEDSDNWVGQKLRLFVAKVEYQGKRVPAIRVEAAEESPKPVRVETPSEEEIPF
jgi:hypothetical protein